jgi:hypothetical protein
MHEQRGQVGFLDLAESDVRRHISTLPAWRDDGVPVATRSRWYRGDDGHVMMRAMPEAWVSLGVVLMGLGGVVAGVAAISLPPGKRLGAFSALIVGAGVGLATLGLGALTDERREPSEFVFFLGSLLGFLTVCGFVWFVRSRSESSEL